MSTKSEYGIEYDGFGNPIGEWLEPKRADGEAREFKPYHFTTIQALGFKTKSEATSSRQSSL